MTLSRLSSALLLAGLVTAGSAEPGAPAGSAEPGAAAGPETSPPPSSPGPPAPPSAAGNDRPRSAAAPRPDSTMQVTGDRMRQVQVGGVPVVLLDEVRIEQGTATVTGDVARYNRVAGRLLIEGSVEIVDGGTRITSDHAAYDVQTRMVHLAGKVRADRDDMTVRAPRAVYERDTRVVRMGGGVEVVDRVEDREVRADSLVYWSDEDRVQTFGSVRIDDRRGDVLVRGETADFDRRGDSLRVSQRASMLLREGGQPVTVSADELVFRSGSELIEAAGGVRVQQGLSESRSREAVFDRSRDLAVLIGAPVARDPSGIVRGDTLELRFRDGALQGLVARGDARSVYRRDVESPALHEEMHLRGDELVVRVRDGEAEEVIVRGNAESIYVPGGERRESGARRNVARGDRIRAFFRHGAPLRAIVEGNASGVYSYVENEARAGPAAVGAATDPEPGAAPATVEPEEGAGPGGEASSPVPTRPAGSDGGREAPPGADPIGQPAPPDSAAVAAAEEGPHLPEPPAMADDDTLLEHVRYRAVRINFLAERDEIVLEDEAEVDYQDIHLTAGRIQFSAERRELVASRDPVLRDHDDRVDGCMMVYDLEAQEGEIIRGTTRFEQGIYTGANLYKSAEGVFDVADASYTTCDLDSPHYHFTGRRMKIHLNDKVVTRPLGLFIGKVPILALPFYIFPIKSGRHSGLLLPRIEFGVSQTRGRFVHNAGYYWAINDYVDLLAAADINERSPFVVGKLAFRYKQRYVMDGDVNASISLGEGVRRWDVVGGHRHDLSEELTLRANANFLSDREFRRDLQGQFVDHRLETQLRSNLQLAKSWRASGQSLRLGVDRTQNLQNESGETTEGEGRVTGTFPSLSYDFNGRSIGKLPDAKGRGGRWPFLATTNAGFGLSYDNTFDTRRVGGKFNQRASGRFSASDRRQAGMVKFGPSFSVRSQFQEATEVTDAEGNLVEDTRYVLTGSWSGSMTLSTDIFGMISPTVGPFHGFRHTMTPRVSVSHTDPFDSRQGTTTQSSSSMSLSLLNRVETRISDGDDLRTLNDFLSLDLRTSYDLANRSARRFSDIRGDWRLRPGLGRHFELNGNFTYDPYQRNNESYAASARFSFDRQAGGGGRSGSGAGGTAGEDGSAAAAGESPGAAAAGDQAAGDLGPVPRGNLFPHSFRFSGNLTFSGGRGDKTLQTSLGTGFNLTPNWRVSYDLRYDLVDLEVISQNYTIARDLHCWSAQFRRTFSGRRWEYYFRISIKDLPEIYYEKGSNQVRTPSFF